MNNHMDLKRMVNEEIEGREMRRSAFDLSATQHTPVQESLPTGGTSVGKKLRLKMLQSSRSRSKIQTSSNLPVPTVALPQSRTETDQFRKLFFEPGKAEHAQSGSQPKTTKVEPQKSFKLSKASVRLSQKKNFRRSNDQLSTILQLNKQESGKGDRFNSLEVNVQLSKTERRMSIPSMRKNSLAKSNERATGKMEEA